MWIVAGVESPGRLLGFVWIAGVVSPGRLDFVCGTPSLDEALRAGREEALRARGKKAGGACRITMRSRIPRAYMRAGEAFFRTSQRWGGGMGNCWRLFFLNLPKNEGWGGGMGNCWSCFISSRDGFGRALRSRKIIQRFGFVLRRLTVLPTLDYCFGISLLL